MGAGEIALEVFKPEGELVGIETLGTAAKLRALQLLDDGSETLDLAVAMLNRAGNIANQTMQKCRFCREIVEIELHIRFYSNTLIRGSNLALFDAGFCDSAGEKWSPESVWRAPIDSFDQHRELRGRQRHRAARLGQSRPEEISVVDTFGEQAQPCPIPK